MEYSHRPSILHFSSFRPWLLAYEHADWNSSVPQMYVILLWLLALLKISFYNSPELSVLPHPLSLLRNVDISGR
jgi:hypothetical protein